MQPTRTRTNSRCFAGPLDGGGPFIPQEDTMKTEKELLKIAKKAGLQGDFLLRDEGHYFPFQGNRMINPLDPFSALVVNQGQDVDAEYAWRVCRTILFVTTIKRNGFEVITETTTGAPKVIKSGDRVLILPEESKKAGFILELLSSQLSGASWKQEAIAAWGELGFTTPRKATCTVKQQADNSVLYTMENGERIAFVHLKQVEPCIADIEVRWLPKAPSPEIEKCRTTPVHVYDDKGVQDEGN